MATEQFDQKTVKSYIESIVNAKLVAVLNKLRSFGSSISDEALRAVILNTDEIAWIDSQLWRSKVSGDDRFPTFLIDKIQAGANLDITKLNDEFNETLRLDVLVGDNLFENEGFKLWRRKGTTVPLTGTSGTYTADRVYSRQSTTAGAITLSREESSVGGVVGIRADITAPFAASDDCEPFIFPIVASKIAQLAGGYLNVSFKILTSFSGILPVAFYVKYPITRTFVRTFDVVANEEKFVSVNVPIPVELTDYNTDEVTGMVVSIAPVSVNTTAEKDVWVNTRVISIDTATNWTTSANNIIIKDLKIEKGDRATPITPRPLSINRSLCEYYYENSAYTPFDGTEIAGFRSFIVPYDATTFISSTTFPDFLVSLPFNTVKRVIPGGTLYSPDGVVGQALVVNERLINIGGAFGIESVVVNNPNGVVTNNLTAVGSVYVHFEADAELYDWV